VAVVLWLGFWLPHKVLVNWNLLQCGSTGGDGGGQSSCGEGGLVQNGSVLEPLGKKGPKTH
jgi:hypothetical protein